MHRPDARILHPSIADALVAHLYHCFEVWAQFAEQDDFVCVELPRREDWVHLLGNPLLDRFHAGFDFLKLLVVLRYDVEIVVELCVECADSECAPFHDRESRQRRG